MQVSPMENIGNLSGRQDIDFSSRSPPLFFSEPPKNFLAAGKLDFCPTKIFSSSENISVVRLNVLHAMFYLVQKFFQVWSIGASSFLILSNMSSGSNTETVERLSARPSIQSVKGQSYNIFLFLITCHISSVTRTFSTLSVLFALRFCAVDFPLRFGDFEFPFTFST